MRPTAGSLLRYTPQQVPQAAEELPRYLRDELTRIQLVISALADGQLDTTTVAPSKPRDGMLRLADGTNWNPGSGAGVYAYYGAAWHFLG